MAKSAAAPADAAPAGGATPPPPPPAGSKITVPPVGSYVVAKTTLKQEVEGFLYTQDPVTGTLVLRRKVPGPANVVGSEACELMLLPLASIATLSVDERRGTAATDAAVKAANELSATMSAAAVAAAGDKDAAAAAVASTGAAAAAEAAAVAAVAFEPLPAVDTKSLEKAEEEALANYSDSMSQLNERASPEGQAVFDALHKTLPCQWVGKDSIDVLHQVRIDPPYGAANCVSLDGNEGSLARIVKVLEGEKRRLRAKKGKGDGGPTAAGGDAAAP